MLCLNCWSRIYSTALGHLRSDVHATVSRCTTHLQSMSTNKLFNPFAEEEEAQKDTNFSFYSDPLASFTRSAPDTAAARARAQAAQQSAAAGASIPKALIVQQQQQPPGPRPPSGPPPQWPGSSGYGSGQQPGLSGGHGYQQQSSMGGVPGPRPPPAPPGVGGVQQQQGFVPGFNHPQGYGPQQGFSNQQLSGMSWQQQQQFGGGPGPGRGYGTQGERGRGRGGRFSGEGRGRDGYNYRAYDSSSSQQPGRGRGRGRAPKMPRVDHGGRSNNGGLPDGSRFFKRSFLDDPWEPLMKQLQQQQQ